MTAVHHSERRIVGEFSPPREIVALGLSRLSGRGHLELDRAGIRFDGAIYGAPGRIPAAAPVAVLAVAALASILIPNAEQIAMPAAVIAVFALMWLRFRASELGVSGAHRVPWSGVEHVVRLQSSPDTLAFVLAAPIAGAGSPEQVFFSPSSGVDELVEALRAEAPEALTIDADSGVSPGEVEEADQVY